MMEQEISHFLCLVTFEVISNILHHFNLLNDKYKPNNTNQQKVMKNIEL
jgi:hypothetical protein